ncbi:MAG TPA: potassium transporter TrkH, partial [Azospirillaceae bacterium]|nr:potassium transporter TrkH [Azospirillaceae bacterium]
MRAQVSLRPVLHVIGILQSILGAAMLVPALADFAAGNPGWSAFVGASATTLAVSGSLYLATGGEIERFTIKQTFLLTS